MSDHDWLAVSVPQKRKQARQDNRPKRQARYHVLLWNDDHHSYEYVIEMLQQLFGHPVVLTTTMEHAELKQDQIHSYGKDAMISQCKGSMTCTIEAEE